MHRLKSALLIIFLIGMLAFAGIIIGQGGMTGATTYSSTVVCFSDSDCNDHVATTIDICRNPGTDLSLCVNKAE